MNMKLIRELFILIAIEKNVDRWISLGITEYFNDSSIVIIEWPEILKEIIPSGAIKIQLNHVENDKGR